MFGEVYSFEKEHGGGEINGESYDKDSTKGREFFKNDWFMGPFYSYDQN